MSEKRKGIKYVLDCIECEGFDYAFVDYSDFETINKPFGHVAACQVQGLAMNLAVWMSLLNARPPVIFKGIAKAVQRL